MSSEFNLINLHKLLPITDRDHVLRWLKGVHSMAEKAMRYGYNTMSVIALPERTVTAEALIDAVDTKTGCIGADLALILVEVIEGNVLPEFMVHSESRIELNFYHFAQTSQWKTALAG
jgi:hypothetical protein